MHLDASTVFLLTGVGLAAGVASLLLVGAVLVRLPADYFSHTRRVPPPVGHPALRLLVLVGKNLLGLLLIAMGLVLSVPGIPGQGLLTIFIGLLLIDFPGKYRIERGLMARAVVRRAVNALRVRRGKPPFEPPHGSTN